MLNLIISPNHKVHRGGGGGGGKSNDESILTNTLTPLQTHLHARRAAKKKKKSCLKEKATMEGKDVSSEQI